MSCYFCTRSHRQLTKFVCIPCTHRSLSLEDLASHVVHFFAMYFWLWCSKTKYWTGTHPLWTIIGRFVALCTVACLSKWGKVVSLWLLSTRSGPCEVDEFLCSRLCLFWIISTFHSCMVIVVKSGLFHCTRHTTSETPPKTFPNLFLKSENSPNLSEYKQLSALRNHRSVRWFTNNFQMSAL